jgi:peptidoglycan/xylan/chitin deacetylase (PgdA/CDA1 family)
LRTAAKNAALRAASVFGLNALARGRHRGCARILAYHGVDPDTARPENFDGFQVPAGVFASHLAMLTRRFHVVPLLDIARALDDGSALPENAVALTFDDGYANNLTTAAPLLAKFGCPATFFVTTGFIDGTARPWWYIVRSAVRDRTRIMAMESELKSLPVAERDRRVAELAPGAAGDPYPFMNWEQVRSLAGHGFEIGAHTVRHVALGREPDRVAEEEVASSFRRVSELTGAKPVSFAYPYGRAEDVTDVALAALRRQECSCAVTTIEGMVRPGDDVLRLKRYSVTGNHTADALEALLSGMHAV